MVEFKIGDKVRIVHDYNPNSPFLGCTGTIEAILSNTGKYRLIFPNKIKCYVDESLGDVLILVEHVESEYITSPIIKPTNNIDGLFEVATIIRIANIIMKALGMYGGVKMDIKEFNKKNLVEAKKQFILENNNSEIEEAKKFLRLKQDEIDSCDREIKKYSQRKDELLFELRIFK
jgi:hypothetical protein